MGAIIEFLVFLGIAGAVIGRVIGVLKSQKDVKDAQKYSAEMTGSGLSGQPKMTKYENKTSNVPAFVSRQLDTAKSSPPAQKPEMSPAKASAEKKSSETVPSKSFGDISYQRIDFNKSRLNEEMKSRIDAPEEESAATDTIKAIRHENAYQIDDRAMNVGKHLKSRAELQQLIVAKEVLDRPLALRKRSGYGAAR